jgi:hypothetical protein
MHYPILLLVRPRSSGAVQREKRDVFNESSRATQHVLDKEKMTVPRGLKKEPG